MVPARGGGARRWRRRWRIHHSSLQPSADLKFKVRRDRNVGSVADAARLDLLELHPEARARRWR
eukprot:9465884-Pyramimonas_sp.AAC.1